MAPVDRVLISASIASAVPMPRCVPQSRATPQGNSAMTKKLALTASIAMLMTISGQAFAATAALSDQKAVYAFNAFDHAVATDTHAANAYHYHGGPKFND
jgi:hypothetical protein